MQDGLQQDDEDGDCAQVRCMKQGMMLRGRIKGNAMAGSLRALCAAACLQGGREDRRPRKKQRVQGAAGAAGAGATADAEAGAGGAAAGGGLQQLDEEVQPAEMQEQEAHAEQDDQAQQLVQEQGQAVAGGRETEGAGRSVASKVHCGGTLSQAVGASGGAQAQQAASSFQCGGQVSGTQVTGCSGHSSEAEEEQEQGVVQRGGALPGGAHHVGSACASQVRSGWISAGLRTCVCSVHQNGFIVGWWVVYVLWCVCLWRGGGRGILAGACTGDGIKWRRRRSDACRSGEEDMHMSIEFHARVAVPAHDAGVGC